jgi:hypothetical protein
MPLVVTPWTYTPFIFGKAIFARAIILVLAALWLILRLRDPAYDVPRSWVLLFFAIYVFFAFVSAITGVNPGHSLASSYQRMTGAADLVLWFVLAVVASSILRTPRAWSSILNWFVLAGFVLSLLAVAQNAFLPRTFYLGGTCTLQVTLGNPSYLGAILVMTTLAAIGLLVGSFLRAQDRVDETHGTQSPPAGGLPKGQMPQARWMDRLRRWSIPGWRVFWTVTAVMGVWVLFHTGSRGALLGLVAGALAMPLALAIWGNRKALLPAVLGAGGILCLVALLTMLGDRGGFPAREACHGDVASSRLSRLVRAAVQERDDTVVQERGATVEDNLGERLAGADGSLSHRLEYIKVGFRAVLDRPILGWGHGNFAVAFDRYAKPSVSPRVDQAHNQLFEELATHGAVGTLSFAAMWLTLLWAVVRRRRPPREEVVAYGVLGALAGHFVQNLFLFYTPASMLFWVILVAWVAGQEPGVERATERENAGPKSADTSRRAARGSKKGESPKWASAVLGVVLMSALGLSMYYLVYVPYSANRSINRAFNDPNLLADRLALATKSFGVAPGMSNRPKERMFRLLLGEMDKFSPAERLEIAGFVLFEIQRTLDGDPNNVPVVANGVAILQMMASPQGLEQLDPLVRQLRDQAPQREYTYAISAKQEILKGNFREAIRIIEEFESITPWVSETLLTFKKDAADALRDGG